MNYFTSRETDSFTAWGVQAELKKYDELKQGIAQNVGRQAQLLGVLGSQQAAYKSAFGFTEWRQSCGVRLSAN